MSIDTESENRTIARSNPRHVTRENLAVLISLVSLLVSFASFQAATKEPKLFASGTVRNDTPSDILPPNALYLARITIDNLGRGTATEVTISIYPLNSTTPTIHLSPPQPYTTHLEGNQLHIAVSAIGGRNGLTVFLWDSSQAAPPAPGGFGPPYFVFVTSHEGGSHLTIIGLDGPSPSAPSQPTAPVGG